MIVHAILDAQDGGVLDGEVLQNSDRDLSSAAMDLVRSTSFSPSGFQQEVFVNVQFHLPAVELCGPSIFHSSVRRVIWQHPRKAAPVRLPSRSGKQELTELAARNQLHCLTEGDLCGSALRLD